MFRLKSSLRSDPLAAAAAWAMSTFSESTIVLSLLIEREPRMHKAAERSRLQDSFVWSQFVIVAISEQCFSASFVDSSLMNLSVFGLQPPYAEKTSGVKELCSTSKMLLLPLGCNERCSEILVHVSRGEGIEDHYVKKCALTLLRESSTTDIQSCIISISGGAW